MCSVLLYSVLVCTVYEMNDEMKVCTVVVGSYDTIT